TDFLRLAALNIRRELLDMAKKYYGPLGVGAHHASQPPESEQTHEVHEPAGGGSLEPARLAAWGEFHEQVERPPREDGKVVDLRWYQGLTQAEAGELLKVNERTVKRRWQSARIKLHEALHGELPE